MVVCPSGSKLKLELNLEEDDDDVTSRKKDQLFFLAVSFHANLSRLCQASEHHCCVRGLDRNLNPGYRRLLLYISILLNVPSNSKWGRGWVSPPPPSPLSNAVSSCCWPFSICSVHDDGHLLNKTDDMKPTQAILHFSS